MRHGIRLPTLYPMPRDIGQYRTCFEEALKEPSVEEYVSALSKRLLREDRKYYAPSYISKIVGNLSSTAFIRREAGKILPPDNPRFMKWNGTWDLRDETFSEYADHTILKWGAVFPELLVLAHDILAMLSGSALTAGEVLKALAGTSGDGKYDGRDRYARRTLREVVKLLEFAEWVKRDGRRYAVTTKGTSRRSDVRKRDPYYRVESILTTVDPAETTIFTPQQKIDLSKHYMYRECGGKYKGTPVLKKAHRILFQHPYHKKLRPAINDQMKAEGAKVGELKDEIANLDGTFYGLVLGLRSRTKLGAIRDALRSGQRDRAFDLIQQSGGHFSWEGALRLRHDGPAYTLSPDMEPYDWQQKALARWEINGGRGILQVVTGAGKTVFGLMAIANLIHEHPQLRVTVLVPTKVLMYQWAKEIVRLLNVPTTEIGLRGDGHKDSFSAGKKMMITIINSAVQDRFLLQDVGTLPRQAPHALMADECHRYRGGAFRKAFAARVDYALGLSATPHDLQYSPSNGTTECDPLQDTLGDIFFEYTYREALADEIIQPFVVKYVGVELTLSERAEYEAYTKQIRKSMERIRARYGPRLEAMSGPIFARLHSIMNTDENPDSAIATYFRAVRERKDLVFAARNRKWAYLDLMHQHCVEESGGRGNKIIVFHERIGDLEEIVAPVDRRSFLAQSGSDRLDRDGDASKSYGKYMEDPLEEAVDNHLEELFFHRDFRPVMYHSGHTSQAWNEIGLELFRAGIANVMLSVRALVEGVDVPSANIGIIRSSSSSVRQRIQTTGRILRRASGKDQPAVLYVLYVRDSTDERIFRGIDWSEQLGDSAVESYHWYPPEDPTAVAGLLTDQEGNLPQVEEYDQEGGDEDTFDVEELEVGDPYPGRYAGREYHVDSKGRPFRKARSGRQFFANEDLKAAARQIWKWKRGGKFVITPENHIVTKLNEEGLLFVGTVAGTLEMEEQSEGNSQGKGQSDKPPTFEDLFR